jgi:nucleoside phosphorylase
VDDEFAAVREIFQLTHFQDGYAFASEALNDDHSLVVYQSNDRFSLAASGSVTKIVRDYLPEYLLVVGIAGGIACRGVALGDVVIPSFVHYPEIAKHVDNKILWRYVPFDHPSTMILGEPGRDVLRQNQWLDHVEVPRPEAGVPQVHLSESIIAGDKIWGSIEDASQEVLLDRFDDAVAVETESAGVARAVFSARCETERNLQYAVIRGVSDLVDVQDNQATREIWRPYAAHVAAAFALQLVKSLNAPRRMTQSIPTDLV